MVSGLVRHWRGAINGRLHCPPHTGDDPLVLNGSIWAEDFLFAGTSALLLLVAGLWPSLWYLAFLAFIPFLHRVVRADPVQALRLGFLLGISYFAVSLSGPLCVAPVATLFRVIVGTVILAGFGWTVGTARRRWGFNPLVTALLWVFFEFVLIKAGFAHGLFSNLEMSSGFLYKTGILFGFLAVSFIVVLVNAILVLAIETAIDLAQARGSLFPESERLWDPFLPPGLVAQRLYLAADGRGPPAPKSWLNPAWAV